MDTEDAAYLAPTQMCTKVHSGLGALIGNITTPITGSNPETETESEGQTETSPVVTDPTIPDPGYTDPGYTDPGDTDPGYTDPGDTGGYTVPDSQYPSQGTESSDPLGALIENLNSQ